VLVVSNDANVQDVSWATRALGGVELVDEKTRRQVALLAVTSTRDNALTRYRDEAVAWATVTPVVLPGFDDPGGLRARLAQTRDAPEQMRLLARLSRRREGLVRKAFRHAGLTDELVFGAQIVTREAGFFAGVELASRYAVPQHLAAFPRLHVHVTWPRPVPGPLCIGRGRYSGLGLFASIGGHPAIME
jgi:CRISPR-associated protein Csb2